MDIHPVTDAAHVTPEPGAVAFRLALGVAVASCIGLITIGHTLGLLAGLPIGMTLGFLLTRP